MPTDYEPEASARQTLAQAPSFPASHGRVAVRVLGGVVAVAALTYVALSLVGAPQTARSATANVAQPETPPRLGSTPRPAPTPSDDPVPRDEPAGPAIVKGEPAPGATPDTPGPVGHAQEVGSAARAGDENLPSHWRGYVRTTRKECESGNADGCELLSRYYRSTSSDADYETAFGLALRACDGESRLGCLAASHDVAIGLTQLVLRMQPETLQYWECDGDNPAACAVREASEARIETTTLILTLEQAYARAESGCHRGFRTACLYIAQAKVDGMGVAVDRDEGVSSLDSMCTDQLAPACAALMTAYPPASDSPDKYCAYARKSCDLGLGWACEDMRARRCPGEDGVSPPPPSSRPPPGKDGAKAHPSISPAGKGRPQTPSSSEAVQPSA